MLTVVVKRLVAVLRSLLDAEAILSREADITSGGETVGALEVKDASGALTVEIEGSLNGEDGVVDKSSPKRDRKSPAVLERGATVFKDISEQSTQSLNAR